MTAVHSLTLFADPSPTDKRAKAFFLSVASHSLVWGLVFLGLSRVPHLEIEDVARPANVRVMKPFQEMPQVRWTGGGSTNSVIQGTSPDVDASVGKHVLLRATPPAFEQLPSGEQTLIQPDAPPKLPPQTHIQVPVVAMWDPETSPAASVALPPLKAAAVIPVRPAILPPNNEPRVADIKLSPSLFAAKVPVISGSTTAPIVVHGPEALKQVPQTSTASSERTQPAQILSLSDVPMPQEAVTIPLANQTAYIAQTQSLRVERGDEDAGSTRGKPDGAGRTAGTTSHASGQQTTASGSGTSGGLSGGDSASIDGSDAGPAIGSAPKMTRIRLPENGQYGVVVVGSSLAEEYPETVALWGSRLVYTVYLHVGKSKNWILQYAVPRTDETVSAGNNTRPDAPWPFEVVRPDLTPGDASFDALMVHGFVNVTGHFEQLALISPQEFPQAEFVLSALKQWQFRPANQNGKVAAVEVLLIIPEEIQ